MKLKPEMNLYENDSIQINKSELCHKMQQILYCQRDRANSLRKFPAEITVIQIHQHLKLFFKCFPWVLSGL